jgi:H2-forming N5,N10-methylenetetrahydromethanopterin dehydrogenase-like enzyme
VRLDCSPDLLAAVVLEAVGAERCAVATYVDHGLRPAALAPHHEQLGIIAASPAADDGTDLDVVAVVEGCVAGDQAVSADDQHRLAVETQALHQVLHAQRAWDVDIALGVVEVHLHAAQGTSVA